MRQTEGFLFTGGTIDPVFVSGFLKTQGCIRDGHILLRDIPDEGAEPDCAADRDEQGKFSGIRAGIIAADRGLAACSRFGLVPDLIVGDFDSLDKDVLAFWKERDDVKILEFPPEKDWTDTQIAVDRAVRMGWKKLTVFGGFGTRMDHVLGNIQVMSFALSGGLEMVLVDGHNRLTMHEKSFRISARKQWGKYVSFFAFGEDVTGLTLRGFRYEVTDFMLGTVGSRAVSNEIVSEQADVIFESGRLLMAETRD